jgi:hypothetical protein
LLPLRTPAAWEPAVVVNRLNAIAATTTRLRAAKSCSKVFLEANVDPAFHHR